MDRKSMFEALNDALMTQLDRLQAADMGDALKAEVSRAEALTAVCNSAISNANTAMRARAVFGSADGVQRMMLGSGDE